MRYDFVFSLGAMCACSSALRRNGLQYASYPFDWVLGSNVVGRVRMICEGFSGFLQESDLEPIVAEINCHHAEYLNRRTGIHFVHDFPLGTAMDEAMPAVRDKYARRFRRLTDRIARSGTVLAVYMNSIAYSPLTVAELHTAHQMLSERFPSVRFTLLGMNCLKGVDFQVRSEKRVSDSVILVEYDYDGDDKCLDANAVDRSKVDRLFSELRLEAVDYRTPGERRRHRLELRRKRYARYGVRTVFGYWFVRFEYRIFRHLEKRLKRRGVALEGR